MHFDFFYEDTIVLVLWPDGHNATHWNCNRVIGPARDETSCPSSSLSCREGHYPGVLKIVGMSPVKSV